MSGYRGLAEVFRGWSRLLAAYQYIAGGVPELQLNVVEGSRRKLYWRWIFERNAVSGFILVLSDSYSILPRSIEDAAHLYQEGYLDGVFFRLSPAEVNLLELWFRTALVLGYYRIIINLHRHRFGDHYVYTYETRRNIALAKVQRHQFATLADLLAEKAAQIC
ncbi:MAG: hypothetical protein QXI60_00280 [Thermofilaceae archaeon]